jgi:hypothetical protein
MFGRRRGRSLPPLSKAHSIFSKFRSLEIISKCKNTYGWDGFDLTKKHDGIRSLRWIGKLSLDGFSILSKYFPNLNQVSILKCRKNIADASRHCDCWGSKKREGDQEPLFLIDMQHTKLNCLSLDWRSIYEVLKVEEFLINIPRTSYKNGDCIYYQVKRGASVKQVEHNNELLSNGAYGTAKEMIRDGNS